MVFWKLSAAVSLQVSESLSVGLAGEMAILTMDGELKIEMLDEEFQVDEKNPSEAAAEHDQLSPVVVIERLNTRLTIEVVLLEALSEPAREVWFTPFLNQL